MEEGLEGLAVTFRTNNIDGAELLGITKDTLVELRVGERQKLITVSINKHYHYGKKVKETGVYI